jgi:hypothetical protein
MEKESAINPMQRPLAMHLSLRCRAHSKRTGLACRAPAVSGWFVCRMHGARGGAPIGEQNGRFETGLYTAEVVGTRSHITALARAARALRDDF